MAISLNEEWLPTRCRELGLKYVGNGHEPIRRDSETIDLFLCVTTVDGKKIEVNTPEAQQFDVLWKEYHEKMTKIKATLFSMLKQIKEHHYIPEQDNNQREDVIV